MGSYGLLFLVCASTAGLSADAVVQQNLPKPSFAQDFIEFPECQVRNENQQHDHTDCEYLWQRAPRDVSERRADRSAMNDPDDGFLNECEDEEHRQKQQRLVCYDQNETAPFVPLSQSGHMTHNYELREKKRLDDGKPIRCIVDTLPTEDCRLVEHKRTKADIEVGEYQGKFPQLMTQLPTDLSHRRTLVAHGT
jgi:hypothetical protein